MTPDEKIHSLELTVARLEGRVDAIEAAVDDIKSELRSLSRTLSEVKTMVAAAKTWQSVYTGLIALILGGLIAAGYELLRR